MSAFSLGAGPDVCLLLHGLTGGPSEVRPVGEALAAAGIRAVGPALPGHGTSPADLMTVTRDDLREAVLRALAALRGARKVFVCGLSAGALLALELAAHSRLRQGVPEVQRLALLAPAVEMRGLSWVFTNLVGRLPGLPLLVGKRRGLPLPGAALDDG
jgi:carboxylesterase